MTILLLGEYSNFHNSLKSGLELLGHKVVLAGRRDGFKDLPVDISFEPIFFKRYIPNFFRQVIYRFTNFDVACFEVAILFLRSKDQLKGFDFVQLINEYPIKSSPYLDKFLLKFIFKHNKNVFVSACGNDVVYINYILNTNLKHHTLTPYLIDPSLKKNFQYSLAYLTKPYQNLSKFVLKNIKAYIPADMDYYMAYKKHTKAKHLIPFPVNIDKLEYIPLKTEEKIKIFHGINQENYLKKGNDYFQKALKVIKEKYGDRVIISEVENVPYKEYISLYNDSHILLDQVYAYDQGYNALEAMAKGKVVFSGFSDEFIKHYDIDKTIGIHTIPDMNTIVDNLSNLIENPKTIIEIGKNARAFIIEYHDYKKVAEQYIDCWKN
ncbi:MAG: glycosyltransferase family protein [Jejuia sp.]